MKAPQLENKIVLEFPLWRSGLTICLQQNQFSGKAWVQSPAWELPYATSMAKGRRKGGREEENCSNGIFKKISVIYKRSLKSLLQGITLCFKKPQNTSSKKS